jgi:ABC-type transporter Mla subunit MlaD
MAQIQYSQSSIAGLKEALAALQAQAAAVGTGSTAALAEAINAEVTARANAINAAVSPISTLVTTINGDSTTVGSFRKEIADLIGAAPEALNTLKEIADYIAVNPNASVADAINAAIASVNAAVAAIEHTRSLDAAYLDNLVSNYIEKTEEETVTITVDMLDSAGNVGVMLNFGIYHILNNSTVRHVTAEGVTYDLEASNGEGGLVIPALTGYLIPEIGTLVGKTVTVQYTHLGDATSVRNTLYPS